MGIEQGKRLEGFKEACLLNISRNIVETTEYRDNARDALVKNKAIFGKNVFPKRRTCISIPPRLKGRG